MRFYKWKKHLPAMPEDAPLVASIKQVLGGSPAADADKIRATKPTSEFSFRASGADAMAQSATGEASKASEKSSLRGKDKKQRVRRTREEIAAASGSGAAATAHHANRPPPLSDMTAVASLAPSAPRGVVSQKAVPPAKPARKEPVLWKRAGVAPLMRTLALDRGTTDSQLVRFGFVSWFFANVNGQSERVKSGRSVRPWWLAG
jgi:hypothetical protein